MFDSYDEVFGAADPENGFPKPRMLRQRKSWRQKITFWLLNLLIMPLVAATYLTIGAHGLRNIMGVFAMKLYKLPIPGVGLMKGYDGWSRLDLAMPAALLLFIAVTIIWTQIFKELQRNGGSLETRNHNPLLFYLLAAIAGIIILGDTAIFYTGLSSRAASSWSETPSFVPIAASVIYMAGLALIGAWHSDYQSSGVVS